MMRKLFRILPLMVLCAAAIAQSPYSVTLFNPVTMTATSQTSAAIVLGQKQGTIWKAGSYSAATITLTGSSLTTATVAVQGSADGGTTYFALPINAILTPGTTASTVTATAGGLYQVNLAGLTHVRFVTSGTFTATSIALILTASPNAMIGRSAGGGAPVDCSSVTGAACLNAANAFTNNNTITSSGTPLVVTSSDATTNPLVGAFVAPNMGVNGGACAYYGRSYPDLGMFCLRYIGNNDPGNFLDYHFFTSVLGIRLFNNNAHVVIGGLTDNGHQLEVDGDMAASSYVTLTNCSSAASPAVCGSAASGAFTVAAAATTVTVNTTAVTANSQIQVTEDASLSARLGVTCNTSLSAPVVTARTAATSFAITVVAPVANPACYNYTIIN